MRAVAQMAAAVLEDNYSTAGTAWHHSIEGSQSVLSLSSVDLHSTCDMRLLEASAHRPRGLDLVPMRFCDFRTLD